MSDERDVAIGRIDVRGPVWLETPDQKEANDLRSKARRVLDEQGDLSNHDLKRMVSLLFLRRA